MKISKLKTLPFCVSFITIITLSACGGGSSNSSSNIVYPIVSSTDTTDPVITLKGPSTMVVIQSANYIEAGATAADNRDGNITNNIVTGGEVVNSNAAPGSTFTLTYNVSDAAGNPAIEVTRSVSVIENSGNQIPVLSAATILNHLKIINNARAQSRSCGVHGNFSAVAAVTWSDKLYKSAYEHSQDLAETNTFSHQGSATISDWSGYPLNKGSSMSDRVATYGYSWSRISENITVGLSRNTVQSAVDSWLKSDDHCRGMMDSNVTEVGMALSSKHGTIYTHYWTQNFGKPR